MFTHNNYQAEDPQQNMQMQTQASRKQYSMIMIAIVSVVVFTLFALVVHRQQIAGASRLQYDTAVEHNFVSKKVFTGKEWPPLCTPQQLAPSAGKSLTQQVQFAKTLSYSDENYSDILCGTCLTFCGNYFLHGLNFDTIMDCVNTMCLTNRYQLIWENYYKDNHAHAFQDDTQEGFIQSSSASLVDAPTSHFFDWNNLLDSGFIRGAQCDLASMNQLILQPVQNMQADEVCASCISRFCLNPYNSQIAEFVTKGADGVDVIPFNCSDTSNYLDSKYANQGGATNVLFFVGAYNCGMGVSQVPVETFLRQCVAQQCLVGSNYLFHYQFLNHQDYILAQQ